MCDNFSATYARTVISGVPPDTVIVILFLAFSNWKMITKLYTHRNLRPFNSIVVENPTIPNYSPLPLFTEVLKTVPQAI